MIWWSPRRLTWPEVDPARHPFDPSTVAEVVARLAPVPSGDKQAKHDWCDAVDEALAQQYGTWAKGWRWSVGEGDFDGGPVGTWCCVAHSMRAGEDVLGSVRTSLLEWRGWIEHLDESFERYLPIRDDDPHADWERAVAHLITVVVDQTGHESGWYGHCEQVLSWFLTRAGIPLERHQPMIEEAIGGRFESWIEPKRALRDDVADKLAAKLTRG